MSEIAEEETIIETEGVKVNFGDFWALKGIDIKVKRGEIIVILGPSGSGKSTFIRTLNRLQPHNGGTIEIDGITMDEDTTVKDLKYVRSEIGFVFQQFNLFPHLTIMENITLAPMKVKGMSKREAEAKADALAGLKPTKCADFKSMSNDELNAQIVDAKKKLFELRMRQSTRKEYKGHHFGILKTKIAQIRTVKREREVTEGVNKRDSRKIKREERAANIYL